MNPPADSRWTPGDRALVIEGSFRGLVGRIKGAGVSLFGHIPTWRMEFQGELRTPEIRDDFLAPVPMESDDDVLGPLRRVRCP